MDLIGFGSKQPFASEQLTVSTATTLTPSVYNATSAGATSQREYPFPPTAGRATAAVVEVLTNDIYYTTDGTVPASTSGHVLSQGDVLTLVGPAKIAGFKLIKGPSAANATVTITYYR